MLFSDASFRTSGVTYGAPSAAPAGWAAGGDGAGSAFGVGAGSGTGLGAGLGAGAAPMSAATPIRANSPPTGTVASSSALILTKTPATGGGISVSTLSVDTSTSGSST
ncbi:Uncharacterised protein [Mycobacterium tuberculosis]|nr:Uncharacterised protein [Mycobacterium tuberculosis]